MSDRTVTLLSPNPGDSVLACVHAKETDHGTHFFEYVPPVQFVRPAGDLGTARWAVLCEDCFKKCNGNPNPYIGADYDWVGGEPIRLERKTA